MQGLRAAPSVQAGSHQGGGWTRPCMLLTCWLSFSHMQSQPRCPDISVTVHHPATGHQPLGLHSAGPIWGPAAGGDCWCSQLTWLLCSEPSPCTLRPHSSSPCPSSTLQPTRPHPLLPPPASPTLPQDSSPGCSLCLNAVPSNTSSFKSQLKYPFLWRPCLGS